MKTAPIRDVAPAMPSNVDFGLSENVWQLTLDQVESETGRIANPVYAPASTAGASTHRFDKRNVLYSKLRPYLNKVVCPDRPGIATTELVPLRPNPDTLDRRYLCYYLRSSGFVNWITGQVAGAKMPRVNMKAFWAHQIPLPTLPGQKRIAAILDQADVIRRKRAQALELADEFLKSAFLDMFGDPVTNPKGWEPTTFAGHGEVTTGNTPSRKHPEYYGDYIEWIKSDNINIRGHLLSPAEEGLSEEGLKISRCVPAGSTLVTCIAGSPGCIGNCAFSDRRVAFNQQINAITPFQQTDPHFLYFLVLLSKRAIQAASTSGMKGMVSKSKFSEVNSISPSTTLQIEFGSLAHGWLKSARTFYDAREESNTFFHSLVQRAFRGEL